MSGIHSTRAYDNMGRLIFERRPGVYGFMMEREFDDNWDLEIPYYVKEVQDGQVIYEREGQIVKVHKGHTCPYNARINNSQTFVSRRM